MNKNKILALFVISLFLIPIASAITYPTLTGYVTDNANMITPEYRQKITDLADSINKKTTVEIAVLTIESLEGDSKENYALNVFRNNGVGKKDNNNGLLILVAKKERQYRFEVGYGLEGTIPDAMKVPIGDKIITPNFKNGDYGKGIYESMLAIDALVTNNTDVLSQYGLVESSNSSGGGGNGAFFLIVIIGFLMVLGIIFFIVSIRDGIGGSYSSPPNYSRPSVPTYRSSPSHRSNYGSSSTRRSSSSSSSSYSSFSSSHSHSNSGGFGGFGGGRSGGGGFGGGW